jgi:cyclin B
MNNQNFEGKKSLISNKENIQPLGNLKKQKMDTNRVFGKEIQNLNLNGIHSERMIIEEQALFKTVIPQSVENKNPQLVVEFQNEIMEFLKQKEETYQIDNDYMTRQKEINVRMRSILIDWLVDVNIKFKLLPQTLFITVNILDRFLNISNVTRQTLQLVGVTALMIVTKYEEIYPPLIKDFIAVCDNAYSKENILEMEARILLSLEFDLMQTSSLTFLNQLQLKVNLETKALVFARYILENALFDLLNLKYSNLELAAGAIFLVNKIFKKDGWKSNFQKLTKVDEVTAKSCAKDLYLIMQKVDCSSFTALKRKFSTTEFYEVSKYRIEKVQSARSI